MTANDPNYSLSCKAPGYRQTNCCSRCRHYAERPRNLQWWCSKHEDYFLNNMRPFFDTCDDWEIVE